MIIFHRFFSWNWFHGKIIIEIQYFFSEMNITNYLFRNTCQNFWSGSNFYFAITIQKMFSIGATGMIYSGNFRRNSLSRKAICSVDTYNFQHQIPVKIILTFGDFFPGKITFLHLYIEWIYIQKCVAKVQKILLIVAIHGEKTFHQTPGVFIDGIKLRFFFPNQCSTFDVS